MVGADTWNNALLRSGGDMAGGTGHSENATHTRRLDSQGKQPCGPWNQRWIEARLREDLDMILAGAEPTRLAPRIVRSLSEELPAADIVIVQRRGDRETVLYGDPSRSRADRPPAAELQHSFDDFTVKAHLPATNGQRRPASYLELAPLLLALADRRRPRAPIPSKTPNGTLPQTAISCVPEVLELFDEAVRIARTDISALLCGETGTGKELLARLIHDASERSDGPFIAVNCAGLPNDLVEAELFGVERGAATGVEARKGMFELADGGTLLLDEIGDMPSRTQATILRVLEEGVVHRVGSTRARPVSIRFLAATNRDVEALLTQGVFREDLYYRLAAWVGRLPPLRDRRADISHLTSHFISLEEARWGKALAGVRADAMGQLIAYHWPGNIRQLKNEVGRAFALTAAGQEIASESLSVDSGGGPAASEDHSLNGRLRTHERDIIRQQMAAANGDSKTAAKRLGLPVSTLYRRMKQLGIRPPRRARG